MNNGNLKNRKNDNFDYEKGVEDSMREGKLKYL
jgi:hypothetical protein